MEIKDTRLINRMDIEHQEEYIEKIQKSIPNNKDKYEEVEISHEPINLLQKIKTKRDEELEPPVLLEQTGEHDDL
jgi:hypothetical protein